MTQPKHPVEQIKERIAEIEKITAPNRTHYQSVELSALQWVLSLFPSLESVEEEAERLYPNSRCPDNLENRDYWVKVYQVRNQNQEKYRAAYIAGRLRGCKGDGWVNVEERLPEETSVHYSAHVWFWHKEYGPFVGRLWIKQAWKVKDSPVHYDTKLITHWKHISPPGSVKGTQENRNPGEDHPLKEA